MHPCPCLVVCAQLQAMALTFIGKSPDPLPIPPGQELESQRFTGLKKVPAEQRPPSPSRVRVRFTYTDRAGRIKTDSADVEPLPENCTVQQLVMLLHEFGPPALQLLSVRHPIEVRYHGETLDKDKTLADYAVKEHSVLQLVVKPKLADFQAHEAGESSVTRVLVVSHKLAAPIPVDGISAETTVLDLKKMLIERLKASPIYLVRGPVPPVAMAREPIKLPQADGPEIELRVGEQFVKPPADAGGGGGGKKGGGGGLRRVPDGLCPEGLTLDMLWPLTLDLENDKLVQIYHKGWILPDEKLLNSSGLINNEQLYLNFRAPWEPDEPPPGQKPEKGGGKKKK